jgi:hypothetical protein
MLRIQSPQEARRAGGYDIEACFDLSQLDILRERMVEVVGPAAMLRSSLARYLIDNGYDFAICGVPLGIADGGHAVASVMRAALERSGSPEDCRVFPRTPLPLDRLRDTLARRAPRALKAWLDTGAWVCGEPAAAGHLVAVAPVLLPLARMRGRRARSFLLKAS